MECVDPPVFCAQTFGGHQPRRTLLLVQDHLAVYVGVEAELAHDAPGLGNCSKGFLIDLETAGKKDIADAGPANRFVARDLRRAPSQIQIAVVLLKGIDWHRPEPKAVSDRRAG